MKFPAFILISMLTLILQAGCSKAVYISKLGWHQLSINFQSVPIQEVLENDQISSEFKEKIRLIQEVKRYGEEKIGLKKTKNYSKYFEVKGSILHVVTASEKDRLEPYCWTFPIVGKVTYKGFFTEKDALDEKRSLDKKGYDTWIRGAAAYSTLGWLKDPIFSSTLKWDEGDLVNLILHEMTHATVYFKKETDLNEQMATFIGNMGAINFLTAKYGSRSKEVLKAVETQQEDLLFSRWIDQAFGLLSKFYDQPLSREEKLKGRERIFLSLQEELRKMKSQFRTETFENLDITPLNNAVILAYRQYFYNLETFEKLYDYFGQDLSKVMALMKQIQTSGSPPSAYLKHWMTEKGLIVSTSLR
jgi:predicted aminopeptidase